MPVLETSHKANLMCAVSRPWLWKQNFHKQTIFYFFTKILLARIIILFYGYLLFIIVIIVFSSRESEKMV